MKIFDYEAIKKVYVVGDIHGEFSTFFNKIKRNVSNTPKFIPHPREVEYRAKLEARERRYREHREALRRQEEQEALRPRLGHGGIRGLNRADFDFGMDEGVIQEAPVNFEFKTKSCESKKESERPYDNSVIIVCGDCGIGFNSLKYYTDTFAKYNPMLVENNCHIIFVRGNHDDPKYFNEEIINFSNIKTVPDYSIIHTSEDNVLCVGGGLSVDRTWRKSQEALINRYSSSKKKKLYWEDEMPFFSEEEIKNITEQSIKITLVATHTCPSFAYPNEKDKEKGWLRFDKSLKEDSERERGIMTELYNSLINYGHNIKMWSYGHFHSSNSEWHNDILFKLIDCDHIINVKNFYQQSLFEKQENKKKSTFEEMVFKLQDCYTNPRVVRENQALEEDDMVEDLGMDERENDEHVHEYEIDDLLDHAEQVVDDGRVDAEQPRAIAVDPAIQNNININLDERPTFEEMVARLEEWNQIHAPRLVNVEHTRDVLGYNLGALRGAVNIDNVGGEINAEDEAPF
mgnify:CR=1 FL=1